MEKLKSGHQSSISTIVLDTNPGKTQCLKLHYFEWRLHIENMKDQVVKVMKAQSAEKEDIEESITKKVDLHEAVLASRACKLS